MCCGNGGGIGVCHSMHVKGRTELWRAGSLCRLCPKGSNSGPHITDVMYCLKILYVCMSVWHTCVMHALICAQDIEAKEDIRCSSLQLSLTLELARLGHQQASAVFPSLPLHSKSTPCFLHRFWAARDLDCWAVCLPDRVHFCNTSVTTRKHKNQLSQELRTERGDMPKNDRKMSREHESRACLFPMDRFQVLKLSIPWTRCFISPSFSFSVPSPTHLNMWETGMFAVLYTLFI